MIAAKIIMPEQSSLSIQKPFLSNLGTVLHGSELRIIVSHLHMLVFVSLSLYYTT